MRKVSKAKGYIQSRYEVDVVLSKKKGVPLPPKDVMMTKLDEIARTIEEFAVEKNRSIGTQLATISFRPKSGSGRSVEEVDEFDSIDARQ